jgi:NADPH:quinone reductase-like Zn-dependent oxidoreductase
MLVFRQCGDAEKCNTALTLGAHHAINYREDWVSTSRQYLTTLGRSGFDIILDMVWTLFLALIDCNSHFGIS